MTVAELIEVLSTMDSDKPVLLVTETPDCCFPEEAISLWQVQETAVNVELR